MKNKKSIIGLALLISGGLLLTNCTKDKTNPAPDPDTDTKAVQDVINAQTIVSDIGEIAAQTCEGFTYLQPTHSYAPLSVMMGTTTINSNAAVVVRDSTNKFFTCTMNNTIGKDGKVRTGFLKFDYSITTLPTGNTAKYFRQAGFKCQVTPNTTLTVNDWTVTINSMTFFNNTPVGFPTVSPFYPANYNLTWVQSSNVTIAKPNGGGTITYIGDINKTLLNTNNTSVPMPTPMASQSFTVYPTPYGSNLYWNKAYESFDGTINGTTSTGDGYVLTIPSSTPLKRNFNNSPEAFAAVNGMLTSSELHPFISGTLTVKPSSKTVRSVGFGTETMVDYNATVNIDGINYSVDFK